MNSIAPLQLAGSRQTMAATHAYLRDMILNNTLPAGKVLSQVELATMLGVSRTPLREALRMLQEEGLIVAETNRRCRVASLTPEDLDALYGARITLESLAMRISLPQLRDADLAAMSDSLERMEPIEEELRSGEKRNLAVWQEAHRAFHHRITSKSPTLLVEHLESLTLRCDRYLDRLLALRPFGAIAKEMDHRALFNAIRSEAFGTVVLEGARHRARSAILLLTETACDFEPIAIRNALRLIANEPGNGAALSAVE